MAEVQIAADERHHIARNTEEQRLAEAHDSRVAPAQIETDRQHCQDQHVGHQRDELGPLGQYEGYHEQHEGHEQLEQKERGHATACRADAGG
jgi:hypothetical protein